MGKILVQNAGKYEGQKVKLNGWVYNSRRSGKIGFLLFRDGTGIMQCIVVKNKVGEDLFGEFKKLTQETSVSVEGKIVKIKTVELGRSYENAPTPPTLTFYNNPIVASISGTFIDGI